MKFNVALTTDIAKALRSLGLVAEERGGDATRSTFRNVNVRRTRKAILVSRVDGAPMSARDVQAARKVVAS